MPINLTAFKEMYKFSEKHVTKTDTGRNRKSEDDPHADFKN